MTSAATHPGEQVSRDDRAYGLMQSADSLIAQGRWAEAARQLETAAEFHRQASRTYDEARCLQLAATLWRSAGQTDRAGSLLARATSLDAVDLPLAIAIQAEKAETAFAERRYADAIAAFTDALDAAALADMTAQAVAALLRRRATVSSTAGLLRQADDDFDRAFRLLDIACGREAAAFVGIEQISLFWNGARYDAMERALAKLQASFDGPPNDPHLAAELGIANARLARTRHQFATAARDAVQARDAALRAVAPVSYFGAAVELAEAHSAQDQYAEAYGALATCWATLSDLIGDAAARAWVEPVILGFVARWGKPAFQLAKSAYEAERRTAVRSGKGLDQ